MLDRDARTAGVPSKSALACSSCCRGHDDAGSWGGAGSRDGRRIVPAEALHEPYLRLDLTAEDAGGRLGTSRSPLSRSVHTLAVPVRSGGTLPLSGPEDIELVSVLRADLLTLWSWTPPASPSPARRSQLAAVPPPGAAGHPVDQGPAGGWSQQEDTWPADRDAPGRGLPAST